MKLVAQVLACVLVAAFAHGAETVVVDLGVANPATPRTYAVKPGEFDYKLINANPTKKYEIVGDGRQAAAPKIAEGASAATTAVCEATDAQVLRILALALKEKKEKLPDAKRDEAKLTEADIKAVLDTGAGCMSQARLDAAKATLAADRAKFDADQAKFDADSAKPETEKTRLEAEKKRLDAEKARLDKVNVQTDAENLLKIRERFTVTFAGYNVGEGETRQKTFKVVGEDTAWTVVITTQGGSAATTAQAAAKAASPIASDSPNLDAQRALTASHPEKIVGDCKFAEKPCNTRIYVNADQISTLTITGVPPGAVTVTVTAGEFFPCHAISYNVARYAQAPPTLSIPLHMKKGFLGLGSVNVSTAETEAAAIYGVDWCPQTGRVFQKRRMFVPDETRTDYVDTVLDREGVAFEESLGRRPDPRLEPKSPAIDSLPLFLRGKSNVVKVKFQWADGNQDSFEFRIFYQRFWLDAGGFFVFARRTDQSIDTETIAGSPAGTPEMQKVRAIRRDVSIEPSTGIVINVHPGNFPILAFQFGIAANQGRSPSYYGGLGIRAREIGKRGLATLGVGVAMQQELQYPNLQFGESYPSTSPLLKATPKYGLTFPYISLSLGFSFGGVSERANVADAVE